MKKIYRELLHDAPSTVEKIASLGVDINGEIYEDDDRGYTIFMYAAHYCQIELMKLLIDAGANVNAATKDGTTPLLEALTEMRSVGRTKLLIDAGARVNAANKYGETPLLRVVLHAIPAKEDLSVELAKLLIDAGARVNAVDKYGETPLSAAIKNHSIKLVELLIDAGAVKLGDIQKEDIPQEFLPIIEKKLKVKRFKKATNSFVRSIINKFKTQRKMREVAADRKK